MQSALQGLSCRRRNSPAGAPRSRQMCGHCGCIWRWPPVTAASKSAAGWPAAAQPTPLRTAAPQRHGRSPHIINQSFCRDGQVMLRFISARWLRWSIICRLHTTSATRTTSYGARRWRALCRQSSSSTCTHVLLSQPGLRCELADAGAVCKASAVTRSRCLTASDCSASATDVSTATAASVRCAVGGRLAATFSLKRSRHSSMSVITTCQHGTSV